GSMAWGRLSCTVALLQYPDGDDMNSRRVLCVLPRRAKPEKFGLVFSGPKLVLDVATVAPNATAESLQKVIDWVRTRTEFTRPEFAAAFPRMNGTVIKKNLSALETLRLIEPLEGKPASYSVPDSEPALDFSGIPAPWNASRDSPDKSVSDNQDLSDSPFVG